MGAAFFDLLLIKRKYDIIKLTINIMHEVDKIGFKTIMLKNS